MAQTASIKAAFPPDGLLHVAVNAGLIGSTPSTVMRFLAYLAAGIDPEQARNRVRPDRAPLSIFDERAVMEQVNVPQDIRDAIQERHPGKSPAWALRYYMALVNHASERQAESIADGFKAGRPKGSRDSYQRTRRTKAELAKNADIAA